MELSNKILSDITTYMKYSKFKPELGRRETWDELVDRNMAMHLEKFPELGEEIKGVYNEFVRTKKVLPSMRSFQFAGKPISVNSTRIFNCSFGPVDSLDMFNEAMFLLLGGTGVGYSVQKHHVDKLPPVTKPDTHKVRRYLVGDSIEGWADAIKMLMKSYFGRTNYTIKFDFSDIRPKGARLVTSGGKAPGPEPLRLCLEKIASILRQKNDGEKLKPIEAHDIMCHIADAVLAGGIRRAALISLFSADDDEMISCKSGNWWELNPQRGRANNSAVLFRDSLTKESFLNLWKRVELSNAGEPGLFLTNDNSGSYGTNPCWTYESKLLTKDGYKEIGSIVGDTVEIWNGSQWSEVKPFTTGINEIVEVHLTDGSVHRVTPYHKFLITEDYDNKQIRVKAENLIPGMKLQKWVMPVITEGKEYEVDAYSQGFYAGDGNTNMKHSWVYGKKEVCFSRLCGTRGSYNEIRDCYTWHHGEMKPKNFVPVDGSLQYCLDWFAGLVDSDGTATKDENGNGIQIVSIDKEFLLNVRLMLSRLGVRAKVVGANKAGKRTITNQYDTTGEYDCKETFRLLVGNMDTYELLNLGLVTTRVLLHQNKPQRDARQYVRVKEVVWTGMEEETFCVTEPILNQMTVNGIVTGNCAEIALKPNQFCNLTTINAGNIESQEDLNNRAKAAAFIGTLQAAYTDFHYLREVWKKTTEEDALIGVSMTGIADGTVLTLNLEEATNVVLAENERVANLIGINKAARTTCVKPEGTASTVLGTASGIHARHNDYYIRTIRVGKNEAIYNYLVKFHPELIEDDVFFPNQGVIKIPQKSPITSLFRTESPIETLERVKKFNQEWIKPGHRDGLNMHNVSCTISLKTEDWKHVGEWMWENKETYTAISVLPFDGGSYVQAPFQDTTKEVYEEMMKSLTEVDLSMIYEASDETNLQGELACSGDGCIVT